jgi:hypothetical protein
MLCLPDVEPIVVDSAEDDAWPARKDSRTGGERVLT